MNGFDCTYDGTADSAGPADCTGTADCDYEFGAAIDAGDRDEKARYIRHCRMRMFTKLAAVLGGIEGCNYILYWRAKRRRVCRPVPGMRPLVIRSGFMDSRRGRHWKRN